MWFEIMTWIKESFVFFHLCFYCDYGTWILEQLTAECMIVFYPKMVQSEFLLGNINHLVTYIISVSEPSCRMNVTFICYLEPKVFDHFHIRILIPVINVRLPCKRMVQHPGFSKKK